MLMGAIFWGVITYTYGRRKGLLSIAIVTAVAAALSTFSQNYNWLLAVRMMVRFGGHVDDYLYRTLDSWNNTEASLALYISNVCKVNWYWSCIFCGKNRGHVFSYRCGAIGKRVPTDGCNYIF
ncbi:hypothetical protein P3L10_018213 [Capsicum annuum]